MTPTSASEDEVKRYELFCSAASREAYLLNQSTLFVLLAQSILMAASITNASGSSRFLVCCPAIVGALILIATISTMVSGDGRIKSQWRVYLKGIASEDRCKELHGCGKERALSLFPNPNPTPEPRVFNHILPQINCGPDEFQLSSFVIVFQLVGWAVVVAALITSINKEQAIAE